jgi:hypothetical protein
VYLSDDFTFKLLYIILAQIYLLPFAISRNSLLASFRDDRNGSGRFTARNTPHVP